jgi:hypothetical protein
MVRSAISGGTPSRTGTMPVPIHGPTNTYRASRSEAGSMQNA